MERESDQAIKDRQNAELEQARLERAERLGHDIRDVQEGRDDGPSKNNFDALK